ncbi:MFS transporter [Oecophyllibacter saccharovorans]|uniref:MFS transporter n=1 Tax=Oecophyllibacter saccharovorans TaxID=2558360 RepID=A0A506URS4_9PROT|nr:MFS transporter [Oecophyllibacter saccharovorans]QDH14909.1 MFS transporter [Oecophyllibacter saccharovorans]TPW35098.1 MFS transporter [Oecophyllibacter saccharovorans]TPW36047.1 MFS transporter [Oecophyllibacter saccharovorans]
MKNLSAILALSLTAGLMVGAEYLPMPLLTSMAATLHVSAGTCGQSISVSSIFAIIASLCAPALASLMNMRRLLVSLALLLTASLLVGAMASELYLLMASRALLGVAVGAFWSLATSLVMRMFPREQVGHALSFIYTGNALAVSLLPALASYLGTLLGWREVFALFAIPLLGATLWLALAVPALPAVRPSQGTSIVSVLRRPLVRWGITGFMLAFCGMFEVMTYWRPILQDTVHAKPWQISAAYFALGVSAFCGTAVANWLVRKLTLYRTRVVLPAALAVVTLAFLWADRSFGTLIGLMLVWGAIQSIIPITASLWVADDIADAPEAAGGLMNACIQGSILTGAFIGGAMLDHWGGTGVIVASAVILVLCALVFARELICRPAPASPS